MHFHHAMLALGANKHVMVEKPMALDLEQAARMTREAQERDLVLCVFQNRRWDLDYLTLRRAVQENLFGRIINVESRLGQWSSCVGPAAPEYHPSWRNEAEYGGGALYDWGSHFIDQIWRLLWPAKPIRVFAQLRGNVWSKDCDDFARVCIDFDSGSAAMVEINTTTTRPLPRWHVDGTTGSATSPHSPDFEVETWARFEYTPANHQSPRPLDPALNEVHTESQLWTQFAQAIQSKTPPPITPQSVLCTMSLLDAARQSSQEGKTIDVQSTVDWIY
jgi:predicted dehydrogenase